MTFLDDCHKFRKNKKIGMEKKGSAISIFFFSIQFIIILIIIKKVIKLTRPYKKSKCHFGSLDCKMVIMLMFLDLSVLFNLIISSLEFSYGI